MRSLLEGDRHRMTKWEAEHGSSLRPPLESVALMACALVDSQGCLLVEYSFANTTAARDEIHALEDEAL
jgi:hypothetical protein